MYILINNKAPLYNKKIHGVYNLLKEQCEIYKYNNKDEAIKFIIRHPDNTIFFYIYSANYNFITETAIIKYISNSVISSTIVFFTFDWWIHKNNNNDMHRNNYLKNVFSAKNHYTVTFCDNIKLLNDFQNINYNRYSNKLIFHNIWSCYQQSYRDFNENPINKIGVPGTFSIHYPDRLKLRKKGKRDKRLYIFPRLDLNKFSDTLNKYLCCFTSSVYLKSYTDNKFKSTHIVLMKIYEIIATGSLLLYPKSEESFLNSVGLFHNENCYITKMSNIDDSIKYILDKDNRLHIDRIRKQGFDDGHLQLSHKTQFKRLMDKLNLII